MSGVAAALVAARLVATDVSGVPHVAIVYDIEPGWHIYWENPGESGMATTADLRGPVGVVKYPGPDRFVGAGDIVTYGWETQAALFFPVTGVGTVEGATRWLACRADSCVPGTASLSLDIPAGSQPGSVLVPAVGRLPQPHVATESARFMQFSLPGVGEVFPDVALAALVARTTIAGNLVTVELRAPRPPGSKLVARSGTQYYQVPEVP